MRKGILSFSTSRFISFVITMILFGLILRLYFLEKSLIKKHRLEKDTENLARLVDYISSSQCPKSIRYNPDFNGSVKVVGERLIFSTKEGKASSFLTGGLKNRSFKNLGKIILINKTEEGVVLR